MAADAAAGAATLPSLDAHHLLQPVRTLRKALGSTHGEPLPEETHDLRTAVRRYQQTLEALGWDGAGNERRGLRALKRIRKRAGKVRDLDVHVRNASSLAPAADQECLLVLLEQLGARRARQARKLQRLLANHRAELRHRLKRTRARLDAQIGRRDSAENLRTAARLVAAVSERRAALRTAPPLNRKTLHPFRLAVKALGDVLRLPRNAASPHLLQTLDEVKDAIGDWHDWTELERLALKTDAMHAQSTCPVRQQLRTIIGDRYARALRSATRVRRHFSSPRNGASGGRAVVSRVSAATRR